MTAELHRIGPWRAALIVTFAAVLALAGWSTSGATLDAEPHAAVKLDTPAAPPTPTTAPGEHAHQASSGHPGKHTSKPHRQTSPRQTHLCTRADGSKLRRPLSVSCPRLTSSLGSLDQRLRQRARRQQRRPTPPPAVQTPAPTAKPSTTPTQPAQTQPQTQTTPSPSGGTKAPSAR